MSKWIVTNDWLLHYRCDHCGYRASFIWGICPRCHDVMDVAKDNNVPNKKDGEQE